MKNKRTRIPMRLKVVLMSILIALVAQIVSAVERKGTIVAKVRNEVAGHSIALVDTNGDNAPDYGIVYFHIFMQGSSWELVSSLLEKGAKVSFDDYGAEPFMGRPSVGVKNLISIGDLNMLLWLPGNEASFPYAAEAQRRPQAATPPATQQSAEERRIADLEAELQRLKQGK